MGHGLLWTDAEDEILRTFYPRGHRGRRKALALLGHRTEAAVRRRVYVLDLVRPRRAWTSREDRLLTMEWGDVTPRTLRLKLPGRTWRAICHRAAHLGLGHPQREMISLEEASRRTGYCPQTLLGILRQYDVALESLAIGRGADPSSGGARRVPRWRVDPVEATDAVRQYLADRAAAGETLAAAAARLGLKTETLRLRLRRAGLLRGLQRITAQGCPTLLPHGLADRVSGPLSPGVARCGAVRAEECAA